MIDTMPMNRALELAARGLYTTDPNPRVGCVLVKDGQVIGEGWHKRAGEAHAEVAALRSASGGAQGATAYVTLEPCSHTGRTPPCADALLAAGIARVVCATRDPNPRVHGEGIRRLQASGVAVSVGLLADEARRLNVGYFSRFERRRPFVRLKLAMSLDARTAPVGGVAGAASGVGRQWITGEASRADVQQWRARSSAVLTGAGTVRVDDPRLDVRLSYGPWVRQPLRVVLDPDESCRPEARIFAGGNALVFAADAGDAGDARTPAGAVQAGADHPSAPGMRIVRVPRAADGLDLGVILQRLAALEINELFVECGSRLAASFLREGYVDELLLYIAPTFLGADAPPLAALLALSKDPLPAFEYVDQRMIDGDLRLILTPKRR